MPLSKLTYYSCRLYLADNCKVSPLQVFRVTFSAKLRDPFRDPSL